MAQDTIGALATGSPAGGVGIVRVSGPDAFDVLQRVVPGLPVPPAPRRLYLAVFQDATGHPIDRGYAVWLPGPRSYTGEDVAELHGHGGPVNLERLLRAVLDAGARPAERGEFTLRGFLNGRIDLCQAEAVIDVVRAPTEAALDLAHTQLRGGLSERIRSIRSQLREAQAVLAVQIDFVDDEPGVDTLPGDLLAAAKGEIEALLSTFARGRLVRSGARVVLLGAPNAGKSSLFNALLQRARAIVTPVPGTTRDFLEETLDLNGLPVTLVDTAGLRDTVDPIEAEGVQRALEMARGSDLAILLVDPTADEPPPSVALGDVPVLVVRTKADLAPAGEVSAVDGTGLEALTTRLHRRLLPGPAASAHGAVVTSARHHHALAEAQVALGHAVDGCHASASPELVAVDVAEALAQLGVIVGETATDDLLDRIFSSFCIGK